LLLSPSIVSATPATLPLLFSHLLLCWRFLRLLFNFLLLPSPLLLRMLLPILALIATPGNVM
jgi:hypothetical protein